MPRYDYKCPECQTVWEVKRRMSDDSPQWCPACGEEGDQLVSGGSGFLLYGRDWTRQAYKPQTKYPFGNSSSGSDD